MTIDAGQLVFALASLLQVITLAICGWTLTEVIAIGKQIERHEQKLSDLPCGKCEIQTSIK